MIKELTKYPKIVLFLLIVFISIFLVVLFSPQKENVYEPPKTNLKSSIYEKFIPGKTTEQEVVKELGRPVSIEERGGKKYYTYPTESVNFNNSVVFKENRVYYSIESFFGDFEKSPGDYVKSFGKPELTLYDVNNDTIVWSVFPKDGVAIAVSPFENLIVKILYFSRQSKAEFVQNFAQEVGLLEKREEHEEEVVAPGF